MDGLEAVEMLFSKTQELKRFDAEFAAHSSSSWLNKLQREKEFIPLKECVSFLGSGPIPFGMIISLQ